MDEREKQEALKEAAARIQRNGGKVNKMARNVKPPPKPGIKLWGALDCLAKYGGYFIIKDQGVPK